MAPVMPFGKHKGQSFDDIPSGYFDWLLKQEWLQPQLRREIEKYLEDDGENETFDFENEGPRPNPTLGFTAEELIDLKRLLQTGFRTLMLQREPEIGGAVQRRLERLAEKLRKSGLMEEIK